jgi:hypothetical protein
VFRNGVHSSIRLSLDTFVECTAVRRVWYDEGSARERHAIEAPPRLAQAEPAIGGVPKRDGLGTSSLHDKSRNARESGITSERRKSPNAANSLYKKAVWEVGL